MKQFIGAVSLPVDDVDKAIEFYTRKLGFGLLQDGTSVDGRRSVSVGPKGASETAVQLLGPVAGEAQKLFPSKLGIALHTDDFWRDYREMRTQGVQFEEEPREEAYSTVAGFEDPYGNRWNLTEIRR